jgi:hypothetical protein
MTFKSGISGNPFGRPPGALNKRTQLARLLEPFAEELIMKVVELARNGDINALRICIDRLVPKAAPDTISFQLPDISQLHAHTPAALANEILRQLAGQEITLEQAKILFSINRNTDEFTKLQSSDNDTTAAKKLMQKLLTENTKDY